ncbi:MAG: DUF5719 family protein [Actinomyces sp.]|jgi:hypothetical protein|nr:DUF5719 family protein [Actinomyces sp.]MCI1788848.1 DUF5719 family protein [Actinomyces sp.]MCI1829522.1 DUF5719 family protein [Actinomyces sp.]
MSRPTLRRAAALLATAAALLGLGCAAAADLALPAPAASDTRPPTQVASPSSIALACAPGVLDPQDPDAEAVQAQAWTSTGPETGGPAQATLTATASHGALSMPTGVVVAGQSGGELRGLVLEPCASASGDQWLAAGSTVVGEDLVLALANPGRVASRVTVSAIGATGETMPAQSVTVPAGQTVTVLAAAWFPDEERPALHVEADGPGVAAWLQSSGMEGEVPTGMTWAASTRAATRLALPGVSADTENGTASVRLGVPGADAATVTVSVSGPEGTQALPGARDIQIDAGTTLDLDLAGLAEAAGAGADGGTAQSGEEAGGGGAAGALTLLVDSDVPVVATAMETARGEAWPDSDSTWTARTAVTPTTALTQARLPGAGTLADLIGQQMAASPGRPTTVSTPSGSGDVTVRLVLANTGDEDVGVSLDGDGADTAVDVAAGATVEVDLPDEASALSVGAAPAQGTVHAAVLATVDTPTGPVSAVWPLGAAGLATQSMPVSVGP